MFVVSLILLQVFIFTGLIIMFRRIMTKNVASATEHLEELNQSYTQKEMELNKRLDEAKQKSQELLTQAQEEAQNLKAQTIKDVEIEREKIISEARRQNDEIIAQAEKSRQALIAELEERIARDAIDKACQLIQDALPEQFKQDVHTHWLEELIKDRFQELERLRLPEDIQEIKITSAFALNEEERRALLKRVKSILGRDVTLKEEVDPRVVAGVIITIGSLILDGTLKNRIQEQAKGASY